MRKPKKQKKPLNDLSRRSLTPFDPNQTLIVTALQYLRFGQNSSLRADFPHS